MNIIYASELCSLKKYNKLFKDVVNKPGLSGQKYHRIMVEGLAANEGTQLSVITGIPVSRANSKKIVFKSERETEGNIHFHYVFLLNLPIIKNLLVFICSLFSALSVCLKNKDTVVICDILNVSVATGALFASKLAGKKKRWHHHGCARIFCRKPKDQNEFDSAHNRSFHHFHEFLHHAQI